MDACGQDGGGYKNPVLIWKSCMDGLLTNILRLNDFNTYLSASLYIYSLHHYKFVLVVSSGRHFVEIKY